MSRSAGNRTITVLAVLVAALALAAYEVRRATVPRLPGETRKFLRLEVWEQ